MINADGSGQARLTSSNGSDPSWSPDGSMIAFSSNRDGDYGIYVENADGTGLTRLTYHNGRDPAWSRQ